MQDETAVVAAKVCVAGGSAAISVCAAFGVTLPILLVALASAMLGVVISLHREEAAPGSTVWKVLTRIVLMGVFAAMVAIGIEHLDWFSSMARVPVGIRAVICGIFANPLIHWGGRLFKKAARDTTGRG